MESIRTSDLALKDTHLALCQMDPRINWIHSIPNNWMASAPGHSFWNYAIKFIYNNLNKTKGLGPEFLTGPVMINKVYLEYSKLPVAKEDPVTLFPPGMSGDF